MPEIERGTALRTIFSFFLGLMLTAFVGVGAYTFHPPPDQFDQQIRDLARQEAQIRNATPSDQLTAEDRGRIEGITRQRNALMDAAADARRPWGRSTSVILIACATLAMVISLLRADRLPVISNGLLLGGVFTMLYGVGWVVAADTSLTRFLVMSAALAITVGLGYVHFVRRGGPAPGTDGPRAESGAGSVELERRLRDLEARMTDAARALDPARDGAAAP